MLRLDGHDWRPTFSSRMPTIHEPFLYQFPTSSTRHANSGRKCCPTSKVATSPESCFPQQDTAAEYQLQPPQKQCLTPAAVRIADYPSSPDLYISAQRSKLVIPAVRASAANKITGFKPKVSIHESHASVHLVQQSNCLPSPPLSSSFSWSRPISSGLDEKMDGECSETGPSAFEFKNFLIRRIESEKPVRFRKAQPMASMRVSLWG